MIKSFFLFCLSPAICVAVTTIAFLPFRKKPGFVVFFNLKQAFWLALFVSVGVVVVSFCGAILTPKLFHLLGVHYEKLGCQDIIVFGFALLTPLGSLFSLVCFIVWIRHLIIAIRLYSQSKINSKNHPGVPI